MDGISNTWVSAGSEVLVILIYFSICLLRAWKKWKSNKKQITEDINGALDRIDAKTEERESAQEKRIERLAAKQDAVINSQQKQIEEQGKQIQELTKLVTKVIDKRVD